jgi:hypothetical protein
MNLEIRQLDKNTWYLYDQDTQNASIDFDEQHPTRNDAQEYLDMMLLDFGTDAENGMI